MKSVVEKAEKMPALKVFVIVIAGVICASELPSWEDLIVPVLAILFLSVYFLFRFFETNAPRPFIIYISGIIFSISIFFLSVWIYQLSRSEIDIPKFSDEQLIILPIQVKQNSKGNKSIVCKIYQDKKSNSKDSDLKIELRYGYNFKGDSLETGRAFVANVNCKRIPNSFIPGEFDYAKYMAAQGVYFSGFVNASIILDLPTEFLVKPSLLETYREKLSFLISANIQTRENALLMAFIAGDKTDLDKETKSSFSKTGTMHLLAVSGLHVGILFLILDTLIPGKKRSRKFRLSRSLLIVLIIWGYAFITGGSPSVLRSALMITVIVPGRSMGRFPPAMNSLAVAGILLLFIEPDMLFKIGFQLSFLALTGILIIQPIIQDMITFKTKLMNKLWGLIAVTLAAQIATTPIVFYYFNTFPVYFLPANLLAVPLAPFVLGGGLLQTLFNLIGVNYQWLSYAFLFPAKLLLLIIDFFARLPFTTVDHIYMDMLQVVMLYLIILFTYIWYKYMNSIELNLMITFTSILIFYSTFSFYKISQTEEILIYPFPAKPWIVHRYGHSASAFPAYDPKVDEEYLKRKIRGHMDRLGVELDFPASKNLSSAKNGIRIYSDLSFGFSDTLLNNSEFVKTPELDIVLLSSDRSLPEQMKSIKAGVYLANSVVANKVILSEKNKVINIESESLISIDPKDYFFSKD